MADEIKIKIPDAYLEMEPAHPPPPAGDMDDKKKTQKAVRKAAATTVFLSAAGIVGYLSGGLRTYTYPESLSVIALFGIFSFGLATLFMSFPRGLDEGSKERLNDPKRGGVGAFHHVGMA